MLRMLQLLWKLSGVDWIDSNFQSTYEEILSANCLPIRTNYNKFKNCILLGTYITNFYRIYGAQVSINMQPFRRFWKKTGLRMEVPTYR